MTRRELLAQGVRFLLITSAVAPSGETAGIAPPATGDYNPREHWWGMIIDVGKCIGCGNCARACATENHVPHGYFRTWVERYEIGDDPEHPRVTSPEGALDGFPVLQESAEKSFFVPKLCNHCADS